MIKNNIKIFNNSCWLTSFPLKDLSNKLKADINLFIYQSYWYSCGKWDFYNLKLHLYKDTSKHIRILFTLCFIPKSTILIFK